MPPRTASLALVSAGLLACGGAPRPAPPRLPDAQIAGWPRVEQAALEARLLPQPVARFPSDATRTTVARSRDRSAVAGVLVCVAASGQVVHVAITAPSAVPDYDADVLDAASAWRFAATDQDVCADLTLRYVQQS